MVRVLGPITVERDGASVDLTPRMLELAAYLATHPRGVTEDQLRCALWPDRSPSPASLRNLLWQTRQRLDNLEGEPVVAMADSQGRYRLHAGATSDFGLLDDVDGDVRRAAAVLRLVRGRPFETRRGFEWAYADGLVGYAERRIVAAAELVAEDAIGRRDSGVAVVSIEAALRAVPTDERLCRVLMRAHAAAGDRSAVEGVLRRVLAAVGADDVNGLEPETVAVYRQSGGRDVLKSSR